MADEKCILDPRRDCLGIQKANMLEKQMSEWKEQSRQTHKEFFNRIRELEIARAEQGQQYTTILEKLEDLTGKVGTLSKGLSDIQAEPGRTWKDLKGKISWAVIAAGITAVMAFLLDKIGL